MKKTEIVHCAMSEAQFFELEIMCDELGLTKSQMVRKALSRMWMSRAQAAAQLRRREGLTNEEILDRFRAKLDGIILTKDPY